MIPSNIPLPTDNLYKFVALSGVVMVLVSIYLAYTKTLEVNLAANDADEQNDILNLEMETIQGELKKLNDFREVISKKTKSENLDDKREAIELVELVDFDDRIESLKILRKEFRISSARFISNERRFKEQLDIAAKLRMVCLFTGGIGAVMAFFGFIFWYRRVQKPLDKILLSKLSDSSKHE